MIQCIGLVTHNHTAYQITNQKGILAIKEMEIVGASPIINEFLCPTMVKKNTIRYFVMWPFYWQTMRLSG